jgi:hypothetical protein
MAIPSAFTQQKEPRTMATTADLSTATTKAIVTDLTAEQVGKKPLKTIHYRMMYLEVSGHSVKEIADAIGYTPDGIYLARQSDVYQRELAKLREMIQSEAISRAVERLNLLVPKAIEEIESILNNPTATKALRLKAAQDILNRVPATSLTLRQFPSAHSQPQLTADELETALEQSNDLLNNLPELQRTVLEAARQRALEEMTQINEALAQLQHDNDHPSA